VKVFVELTRFAATATSAQLRDRVRALEDSGAYGVSFSDHIFFTADDRPRTERVAHGCDPLTAMAAVVALSDTLAVQTVVANTAWIHPALLLRQFAQLAVLADGQRVTAGLGAGWSTEEFDALGLDLPPFGRRLDRFVEVLAFARALFDDRTASLTGQYVTARDVPLSPPCRTPPALLVGGGSDRVLDLAGRCADVVDLHGDPRHGKVAGTTMEQARRGDVRRRALTTVEDLADRIERVRAAEAAAGRAAGSVTVSTQIWYVAYGGPDQVRDTERELCRTWGRIPDQHLDRSPYLLMGEPRQMAEALIERQEVYGLDRISLTGDTGISGAPADPLRFCREVLPLLT
jgi:alkanesulfonate monooxygenase SsuD/methylene tetrahydromethanopterin reductase-like flavin-dependent oxidoreductase (luciferase family)